MYILSRMRARAAAPIALLGFAACARLGDTDRVLLRVPAPDRQYVAVCQEIPAFDGPDYNVRLERPDGTLVRDLYSIGDGDGCSEIAWSPDARLLAVLTAHAARIRFVDVKWALAHGNEPAAYWSWRQIDLGWRADGHPLPMRAEHVAFTGSDTVRVDTCTSSVEEAHRAQPCSGPVRHRTIALPQDVYR
jgi:hypothetical protein